ncbi:MAG: hypothetical protein KatS3mg124_1674 [Porticoccaceae bacterium]|nr:MAG: hypothetical protein KatS3mg124_1674 [Porticoccaceae bacterium]
MDSADEALALLCRAALDPPRAYGAPGLRLAFRSRPADFQVVEELGFAPTGEGEHLLLRIRKEGQNTRWVAHLLARHYGVADEAVSYCGLKDRRAVAEQWFSVHLPGRRDPTPPPALSHCTVLAESRHRAKLRPGMHRRNQFTVVLRGVPGQSRAALEARLAQLARQGVPNYFGPQRFGRAGANLHWVAARLKEGRRLGGRGRHLSLRRARRPLQLAAG